MGLKDTLESSFTAGGFDPAEILDGLASQLSALDLPALPANADIVAGPLAAIGDLDASGIAAQVEQLVTVARDRLGDLPGADTLLQGLTTAISTLEELAGGGSTLTTAVAKSFGPVAVPPGSAGSIDVVTQRLEGFAALAAIPVPAPIEGLAPSLLGSDIRQGAHDILGGGAGLQGLVAALRSLAELRGVVEGIQRLGDAAAALPDPAAITKLGKPVLAWDAAATAARITSGDPAKDILADVTPPIVAMRAYIAGIASVVVLGSATVRYFDVAAARAAWDRAQGAIGSVDPAPIRALVEALHRPLEPLLKMTPGTPAATADAFAAELRTFLASLGASLAAVDATALTKPITDVTDRALAPMTAVSSAIDDARKAMTDASAAVSDAIHALDLDAIAALVKTVVEPLTTALHEIETALAAVTSELGKAATTASASLEEVRKAIQDVADKMLAAFEAVSQVLDQLDVAGRVQQVRTALEPAAAALGEVDISQAASAAAEGIDRVASVVGALPLSVLPASALEDVQKAVKPIKEFDFDGTITQEFAARVEELRSAVDTDVLQQIRDATAEASSYLVSLDPRGQLTAFEQSSIDPVLAELQGLDADALLQPIRDVLAKLPDLTGFLAPADEVFDDLLAQLDAIAPHALLDPVAQQLTAARDAATAPLHLAALSVQLSSARETALGAIDEVGLQRLIGAATDVIERGISSGETARGSAVGQLVVDLTGGPAGAVAASAVDGVVRWVSSPATVVDLSGIFAGAAGQLEQLRGTVRGLDPGTLAGPVDERYQVVVTAIETLPEKSSLRAQLERLVGPSPTTVLTPLVAAKADLDAGLTGAMSQVSALAVLDLRPLGNSVGQLRDAFGPLSDVGDWVRSWVARAGIALEGDDLRAGVNALLAIVRDELRQPASAQFEAQVRTALRTSVTSVLDAGTAAVDRATTLIAAVDLAPLIAELDVAFQQLRTELLALRPSTALADVATALQTLQRDVREFDPLREIRPVLDALKQTLDTASTGLRPTVIFAPVLATYDSTATAIGAIDIDALFDPILNGLNRIADDVDTGLVDVGTAFGKLQAALP